MIPKPAVLFTNFFFLTCISVNEQTNQYWKWGFLLDTVSDDSNMLWFFSDRADHNRYTASLS